MIQPDFKTFSALARQGNLVPVYDTFTADLLTPVGAYLRIAHDAKYSFLLESVEGGENIARYTFAGANPERSFPRARTHLHARDGEGKSVQFRRQSRGAYCGGSPRDTIRCAFRAFRRWLQARSDISRMTWCG